MTKLAVILAWVLLLAGSGVVWGVPLRSQSEVIFGTDFLRIVDDPPESHNPSVTDQVHPRPLADLSEATQLGDGTSPGKDQTKIIFEDPQRRPRNFRLSSRHLGKLDPNDPSPFPPPPPHSSLSSLSTSFPTRGASQRHGSTRRNSFSRRTPQGLAAAVNPVKSTTRKFLSPQDPSMRPANLPDHQEGESDSYLTSDPQDVISFTQGYYDYNYYDYYLDDLYHQESTVMNSASDLTEQESDPSMTESEVTSQSSVTVTTIPTLPLSLPEITNDTQRTLYSITTTTSLPTTKGETHRYRSTTEVTEVNNSTTIRTPQQEPSEHQVSLAERHTNPSIQRKDEKISHLITDTRDSVQMRGSSRSQPPLSLIRGRKIILSVSTKSPAIQDNEYFSQDTIMLPALQSVTTKLPQIKVQITTKSPARPSQSLPSERETLTSDNNNKSNKQDSSNDKAQHSYQLLPAPQESPSTTTRSPSKNQSPETRSSSTGNKGSHKIASARYSGPRSFRYTTPSSKARVPGRGASYKNNLRESHDSSSSSVVVEVSVDVPKTEPGDKSPASPNVSPSSTLVSSTLKFSTISPIISTTVSPPPSSTIQPTTPPLSTSNPLPSSSSASGSMKTVPQFRHSSDLTKSIAKAVKSGPKDAIIHESQPPSRTVQAEESDHSTTSYLLSDPLVVDLTSAASTTTRSNRRYRPDPLRASPPRRVKTTTTTTTTPPPSPPPTTTTTTPPPPPPTTSTISPVDTITSTPSTTSTPAATTTTNTPATITSTSTPNKLITTTSVPSTTSPTTPHTTLRTTTTPSTAASITSTTGLEKTDEALSEVEGLSRGVVDQLQVRRGHSRALEFQTSVVEVTGTVGSAHPTTSALNTASAIVLALPSPGTASQRVSTVHHTESVTATPSQSLSQQPANAATQLKPSPPSVRSSRTQQGVAPLGLFPFGQAPKGRNPFGLSPGGVAPQGRVPGGLHPHGISPQGIIPLGVGEMGQGEVSSGSAGLTLVDATVGAGRADANSTVGYVVEEHNLSRFRLEEKTSDGFIIGEYGVVDHTTGDVNGVRYTADSTADPRLIYESLMKFLKL